MSRVLVISPHPDDESIGCGGTLRKHVLERDEVGVIFLTSGEAGGHGRAPESTAELREAEAHGAAEVLGVERLDFWRQPDGRLFPSAPLVERLRAELDAWRPELVYVPSLADQHDDHRAAARLVRSALATEPTARAPEVLMFEVWTPLAVIDRVVDISAHIETKMRAIQAYTSQCAVMGFEEAFRGLARYRGELHSWPGGDYAEVFARLPP